MTVQEYLDRDKNVASPEHYSGGRKYEPKDVIRGWNLNFNVGNMVKYISRAGRKEGNGVVKDLKKVLQYAEFEKEALKKEIAENRVYNVSQNNNGVYSALIASDWCLPLNLSNTLFILEDYEECRNLEHRLDIMSCAEEYVADEISKITGEDLNMIDW